MNSQLLALEALGDVRDGCEEPHKTRVAIAALEADIARVTQGPVSKWIYLASDERVRFYEQHGHGLPDDTPLYVNPLADPERDRLKALNAELVAALNYAVEFSTEAAMHWDSDYDAKVGKYLLALSGSNKGYDKRTDALHAALAKHKGETE